MVIAMNIDDFYVTIGAADRPSADSVDLRSYDRAMDRGSWPAEAARLRLEAEAKPMKLPVNRRVDEKHRSVTEDGLAVWYTIQVSPHSRIYDVLFERTDRMPSDEECEAWLGLLIPGKKTIESPSLPGSFDRRFDSFERDPTREAPLA
jgi:hypothetical protein